MVTQDLLSDLWGRYAITYKNVAIESSHGSEQTPSASTTLTPQPHNPDKSKGEYKAPLQIIAVLPPMIKPRYRESNEMNPLEQKEKNLAMEKIQTPDPRINKTGKAVKTGKRLENMDIQSSIFNYNGIFGVVGILVGIYIIVYLTRKK